MPTREDLIFEYLDLLLYTPYPVQEEALYAWASCDGGILMSAPTGTGKTLVAEAAVYEGLRTGKQVYYSTPLIALTDQKLIELQATVSRWGFDPNCVGLVTGNRTVNPDAPIKVVVAEVLLNRLLHPEAFDFANVSAVVMDEFHNFNEPQRGIVWELALSLLPKHVRVMLLSATVGAANEFVNWMARSLDRLVMLVEGKERKVPLSFQWVGDELLPDFIERISQGEDTSRRTPALVFCFDRSICWETAEVLKGKDLFTGNQREALFARLEAFDFKVGAGNKLRTLLARGIGVHHAGILPRYRRIVEILFQEKLLPICVCTETLAAGINLPAKSVILTTLMKGPRDKKKLIETGSAQQMFGRAGRPQFDTEGHVFALAHEDDVKLAKWKVKYDSIPETEKDPKLMAAKKALLKKKPTKRAGFAYWNADQFAKLQVAPPAKLSSKGRLSWRWLAYLLEADPSIEPIRKVIRARLMDQPTIDAELKRLTKMLVTLHRMNVVVLEPPPPMSWIDATKPKEAPKPTNVEDDEDETPAIDSAPKEATKEPAREEKTDDSKRAIAHLLGQLTLGRESVEKGPEKRGQRVSEVAVDSYEPTAAVPTGRLRELMVFRAVHPLYGLFLLDYLKTADDAELVQILESLLEMPGSVAKLFRVPRPEDLPPGPLATTVIDPAIVSRGLATLDELYPPADQSDVLPELRRYPIPLAQKVRMVFESEIDPAGGLFVTPVWAIGEMAQRSDLAGGTGPADFDAFVRSADAVKQEGVLFKHTLRMILLCNELAQLTPTGMDANEWVERVSRIGRSLTASCQAVDPQSTDELLDELD